MNRLLATVSLFAFTAISTFIWAGGEPGSKTTGKVYGPFEALTHDKSIIRDVKFVTEEGNLYIQLLPEHKEKEIRVKLSNEFFASYRKWHPGDWVLESDGFELVSPANQGKAPYGWTDWVNTSASYIEYWMDGEVILHLKRVK